MDTRKFAAYFAIATGLAIAAWWTVDLTVGSAAGQLSVQDWFHVAAEALTSLGLVIAGWRSLNSSPGARGMYFVASGMLVYATVSGAGAFAVQGNWAMPVLLLGVACAAVYFAVVMSRAIQHESR